MDSCGTGGLGPRDDLLGSSRGKHSWGTHSHRVHFHPSGVQTSTAIAPDCKVALPHKLFLGSISFESPYPPSLAPLLMRKLRYTVVSLLENKLDVKCFKCA